MGVPDPPETAEQRPRYPRRDRDSAVPGLVVVFSTVSPRYDVLPLQPQPGSRTERARTVGRGPVDACLLDDDCMSRQHVRVSCDGETWSVRDLDSRNGTSVDGKALRGEYLGSPPRVLRAGDTLFVPCMDAGATSAVPIEVVDGAVIGPSLAQARASLLVAARAGRTLFIAGETGAGKEVLARAFHALAAGGEPQPFVAVNCATVPENLAERLLFGARRGAYSGAHDDTDGFLQSASGGTLFLDEIAELPLSVQAKLLRALETGEVVPLGAARAQRVDVRLCAATLKDLRAEVVAGRFRQDLFYRVSTPMATVPPLRDRPLELPWLVDLALGRDAHRLVPHASLVEECLLRPWPGNVRELIVEVRAAAAHAQAAGADAVDAGHLGARAGMPLEGDALPARPGQPVGKVELDDEAIEAAMRRAGGNIARAARALGVHRTQLRRRLARKGS